MDPLLASALFGYAPSPSRFDEAVDESGAVRPIWRNLVATLSRLGGAEIEQRRRQADRLIAASGASYLVHDEADASRPWRLDPVPVVLTADEWRPLADSIAERAVLLDALLADLYGPRTLVRGVIPPEAALGSPQYEWPVLTNRPPPPRWLTIYAADLVRTGDGQWKVLRDLTDAPSGAGYALLNRTVLSRLFPDEHRELGVLRLSDFFVALRAALAALAPEDRPERRTVVLSSGIGHPSYFEHTYLAEQLGYNLAEGGDLTVRHGRVLLRSLGGLEPVDVLLRRVEASAADPLELGDGDSGGVPGLLHACREGGVGLANPLGSGAAGELALHPFLPAASQRLLGRSLRLASLETLWCGDDEQRAEVLAELDSMVVHESGASERGRAVFVDQLSEAERAALLARIAADPCHHVAQRKVEFATTPMLKDGAVVPGTVVLRVHAVLGPDGPVVLPGGLGRVLDPAVPVVTQSSGVAKDVWVVDGRGVGGRERVRLEPRMPQIDLRASLPTRSAEALFWLGRHSERAEAVARLARAVMVRSEQDPALLEPGSDWVGWAAAGLRAVRGQPPADAPGGTDVGSAVDQLPLDHLAAEVRVALSGPGGLIEQTQLVRRASSVREFLSSTTWEVLESLAVDPDRPAESLDRVVVALSALSGLAMESTVRGPSWRLLDLGRRLERALVLLGAVESMLGPEPDPLTVAARYEVVLTAHESLVAYRRRYRSDARVEAALDLLVADDTNPRALAFQLDRMAEHLVALPGAGARSRLEDLLDTSARTVMRASWHDVEPVGGGVRAPAGRLLAVDRLVLDARGPLLDLAEAFVARWFADPRVSPPDGAVAVTRYRIEHRTTYRYGAPMTGGHSVAHLVPRATAGQTVVSSVIRSDPEADEIATWVDAFGNLVTYLGVHHPHERLEVVGTSDVDVSAPALPADVDLACDAVLPRLLTDGSDDALLARVCRLGSPAVDITDAVGTYAAPSFPPGRSLVGAVTDLTSRIFQDFTFDPSFSDVATPVDEVLAHRRGVCQDFAHLAIGCLRAIGLPARYVSGYLETEPLPGQPKLVGADASHAWCSTYLPGWGWLDLDPTNDQVAPSRHVTVAWGRDYRDVAPLRGVVVGPAARQELAVAVDVVRLDPVVATG